MKNILVIAKENTIGNFLENVFTKLSERDNTFHYLRSNKFIGLLKKKRKNNITTVMLLDFKDKIHLTLFAKILGLKTIWIEPIQENYRGKKKISRYLFKKLSRFAKVICFTDSNIQKLEGLKIKGEKVNMGVEINEPKHQDSIFSTIAKNDHTSLTKKHFTIGMCANLSIKNQVETLLKACEISNNVISDMQVIILGDGKNRKTLSWLANKLNIGKITWFVGNQEYIQKWMESFDIFICGNNTLNVDDLEETINAMRNSIPVICFTDDNVLELELSNSEDMIILKNDSELLSQRIIRLRQNGLWSSNIGKENTQKVNEKFILANTIEQINKIL